MHKMEELKDNLMKELEILAMNDQISTSSLEKIHKLTDTIKNIDKIVMLEEYGDEEYSQRGSYDGGSYRQGSYRDGGNSYARRRDSRGRYSRNEYSNERRYSRDDAKEKMVEQIEDMLDDATNEKERQALQRCLTALNNA